VRAGGPGRDLAGERGVLRVEGAPGAVGHREGLLARVAAGRAQVRHPCSHGLQGRNEEGGRRVAGASAPHGRDAVAESRDGIDVWVVEPQPAVHDNLARLGLAAVHGARIDEALVHGIPARVVLHLVLILEVVADVDPPGRGADRDVRLPFLKDRLGVLAEEVLPLNEVVVVICTKRIHVNIGTWAESGSSSPLGWVGNACMLTDRDDNVATALKG
jgi:hypothetical protein